MNDSMFPFAIRVYSCPFVVQSTMSHRKQLVWHGDFEPRMDTNEHELSRFPSVTLNIERSMA